eukprot:sb/3466086/
MCSVLNTVYYFVIYISISIATLNFLFWGWCHKLRPEWASYLKFLPSVEVYVKLLNTKNIELGCKTRTKLLQLSFTMSQSLKMKNAIVFTQFAIYQSQSFKITHFLIPNFSLLARLVPELGGVEKFQNGLKLKNCYIYAVGKRAHFFGKSFWGDGMGSPLRLPAQIFALCIHSAVFPYLQLQGTVTHLDCNSKVSYCPKIGIDFLFFGDFLSAFFRPQNHPKFSSSSSSYRPFEFQSGTRITKFSLIVHQFFTNFSSIFHHFFTNFALRYHVSRVLLGVISPQPCNTPILCGAECSRAWCFVIIMTREREREGDKERNREKGRESHLLRHDERRETAEGRELEKFVWISACDRFQTL